MGDFLGGGIKYKLLVFGIWGLVMYVGYLSGGVGEIGKKIRLFSFSEFVAVSFREKIVQMANTFYIQHITAIRLHTGLRIDYGLRIISLAALTFAEDACRRFIDCLTLFSTA